MRSGKRFIKKLVKPELNPFHKKALDLGFPNANLKVKISFNPENSSLAKQLNKTYEEVYDILDIVERGILIGKVGHSQLMEWIYVTDVY